MNIEEEEDWTTAPCRNYIQEAAELLDAAVENPTAEKLRQFTIEYLRVWNQGRIDRIDEYFNSNCRDAYGTNQYSTFYAKHTTYIKKAYRKLAHVDMDHCPMVEIRENIFAYLGAGVCEIAFKGMPRDDNDDYDRICEEYVANMFFDDPDFLEQAGLAEVKAEDTHTEQPQDNAKIYTYQELWEVVTCRKDNFQPSFRTTLHKEKNNTCKPQSGKVRVVNPARKIPLLKKRFERFVDKS